MAKKNKTVWNGSNCTILSAKKKETQFCLHDIEMHKTVCTRKTCTILSAKKTETQVNSVPDAYCSTVQLIEVKPSSCSFLKKQVLLPCYINARRINEQYLQVHSEEDYFRWAASALYLFISRTCSLGECSPPVAV